MSQFVGMNYIGGFLPSRADFGSFNPITEEPIGYFPQSSDAEINEAIIAAQKAFPYWKSLSLVQRIEYFDRLANSLDAKVDFIAESISLETGKHLIESKDEIRKTLRMVQLCCEYRNNLSTINSLGVVAVIGLSNFPFGGFFGASPLLLEGNTIIFKPCELTPMVGQIIANIFQDAGFPQGVFNLLHGRADVSDKITRDTRIVRTTLADILD